MHNPRFLAAGCDGKSAEEGVKDAQVQLGAAKNNFLVWSLLLSIWSSIRTWSNGEYVTAIERSHYSALDYLSPEAYEQLFRQGVLTLA
jgi:hypothetical protein